MKSLIAESAAKHKLYTISILGFIFTLHLTLPVYVNSVFLTRFVSDSTVGYLYTAGSILTILLLLRATPLLRKFGNYRLTMAALGLQAVALLGFTFSSDIAVLAPLFILMQGLTNLIGFNIDIFLESITDNGNTGRIRSFYLTVVNIAWILAPITAGALGDGADSFGRIYAAAFMLLIPVMILLRKNFSGFRDGHYPTSDLRSGISSVFRQPEILKIFVLNVFLNFFYAWMVIYVPLYLHDVIGFNLAETGMIFTVMLLPFIIFEIPVGRFEDKRWAEREALVAGFFITALATAVLAYIAVPNVWLWALMLFMTRVGAAVTEVTMETYFFKQVDASDSAVLGLFRTTRHIAYITAPAAAGILLSTIDLRLSFLFLAAVMLFASVAAFSVKNRQPEGRC